MAPKAITYVWKITRPNDESKARDWMAAAYATAIQTDPNVTQVLIRSGIHPTTFTGGKHVPDAPHITIAVKNPKTQQNGTHETSHGYTESLQSARIVRVKPSGYVKSDSDNNVWPQGLPREVVQGNPANK
ncbi:MAG: hypothetical protein Q9163_000453 [Psora crenata]